MAAGYGVGVRRVGGAGRGSRCPWWCRIGSGARSSPGAWRTSGSPAAAPPADHSCPLPPTNGQVTGYVHSFGHPQAGWSRRRAGGCGRPEGADQVIGGAGGVVGLGELVQDLLEVPGSGDQEVIEAFAAQRADEAFGDRVGPGCPNRAAEDADVGSSEYRVEGGGELAVPVADQESERIGAVAEVDEQVA